MNYHVGARGISVMYDRIWRKKKKIIATGRETFNMDWRF